MREDLYIKVKKFSLRYDFYLYFDVRDYFADRLFIKNEVRVYYDGEYARENSPFVPIICHVRKRDSHRFLTALRELKKTMIICGYPHYEEEISALLDELDEGYEMLHPEECSEKLSD